MLLAKISYTLRRPVSNPDTLDMALAASGCDHANFLYRPRPLSGDGLNYIARELADYLDGK
jgi:putative transposase